MVGSSLSTPLRTVFKLGFVPALVYYKEGGFGIVILFTLHAYGLRTWCERGQLVQCCVHSWE